MVDANNYLAFADILLYDVVGNFMLLGLIGQIIVVVFCTNKQVPYQGIIMLSLIWWSVLVGMYFDMMIWTFVVLVASTIAYIQFSKLARRG